MYFPLFNPPLYILTAKPLGTSMSAYDLLRRGAPALPNSSPNLYPTVAVIPPQRAQQNPNEYERNWFSLTLSKIEMRKALPLAPLQSGENYCASQTIRFAGLQLSATHSPPTFHACSPAPQSANLLPARVRQNSTFSNLSSHLLFHLFHRDWNAFLAQHATPRPRDNYAILQADPSEIQVLFELRKIDKIRVDPFAPPLLY